MKKILVMFVLGILVLGIIGLGFASNDDSNGVGNTDNSGNGEGLDNGGGTSSNDLDSNDKLGETIRNRVHAGDYFSEDGEKIRVSEMAQNKLRLHVGDVEVDCDCDLVEETDENNRTRLKVRLNNGRNAEIKIMPGVASETALERLRLKVCSEENNCSIELKEVGSGNKTRAAYEVRAEKRAKVFGLFKARMNVRVEVDAETGEIVLTKKPWWAFIASESDE